MQIPIETVKTDRFSMEYFKFGSGNNVLVILPGLSVQSVMGSREAIARMYAPLCDAFTIYVFDRRKALPASYCIADMVHDTADAFASLGLSRVSLFGASQGGMIALALAIEHPGLVRNLVLGSSAARVTEEQYAVFENWIRLANDKKPTELYLAFGEAIYPPQFFAAARSALCALAKTVTDEELKRFVILAEGMRGFDVTEKLKRIACPVLVLGAKDDRVLGANAAELFRDYLGGRADFELYRYDGYGHAAFDTAPDYKERMLRFLTREPVRKDESDAAKETSVLLRPHHGMCFPFYEGKGYSESFTDHMGRVIRDFSEDPQKPVRLTVSTDIVCSSCPNNVNGTCEAADKVKRYDEAVLKACGLKDGDELPYASFAARVKEKVLDAGLRQTICSDCEWNEICKNGENKRRGFK